MTLSQTFDDDSNRTRLSATIGTTADFVTDYTIDALDRVTDIVQQDQSGGNAVADKHVRFAYNAAGQSIYTWRYASAGTTNYVGRTKYMAYDKAGRVTDFKHDGPGLAAIDFNVRYDDHLLDYVTYGGKTLDYAYDTVDQLTTVDYTGTGTPADESYSLDDSGNRTNTGYTTGDHNRLTSDGTYNYQYDANGNRTLRTKISDGTKTEYAWDHRNRLTSVTFKTAANVVTKTVAYEYDAFNRLVHREVDADGAGAGTATDDFWIYDGNQAVLQFDGPAAADLSHRYLWGPAVDQFLADETVDDGGAEDVLWPLTDWQGSVRHLAGYNAATDTTTIENEKFYDAYGNVKSESNSAADTVFGYTGRFFDDDTGLQWNLNRWYDPGVGRWLSEDPIGFAGGDANLYRYVGNGPGMGVDPSGLAGMYDSLNPRTPLWWGGPIPAASKPAPPPRQYGPHWFNNDSTDWYNPYAYFGASGYHDGKEMGEGWAGTFGKDYNAWFRSAEARQRSVIRGLADPKGNVDPNSFGPTRNREIAELADNAIDAAEGVVAAAELTAEVAMTAHCGVSVGRGAVARAIRRGASRPNTFIPSSEVRPIRAGGVESGCAARSVGPGRSVKQELGNLFNRTQRHRYPHNEIYVQSPKGGYTVLDSYNPSAGEIVSRKFTQFSQIEPKSGIGYLNEMARSYKPGAVIADVPSSGCLAGQTLRGQMILEVPIQSKAVPQAVLDAAVKRDIVIRDVLGRVY